MKTVYPPQTKFAGGYKDAGCAGSKITALTEDWKIWGKNQAA